LIGGDGGHLSVHGKIGQEVLNFPLSYLMRVFFAMKEQISPYPIDLGAIGAIGVMLETNNLSHYVQ
jgi:hypothetical protein